MHLNNYKTSIFDVGKELFLEIITNNSVLAKIKFRKIMLSNSLKSLAEGIMSQGGTRFPVRF